MGPVSSITTRRFLLPTAQLQHQRHLVVVAAMIVFLPLFALFLVGQAAPGELELMEEEPMALEDYTEFMLDASPSDLLRRRPRMPPPCDKMPNVTSVQISGSCTVEYEDLFRRRRGKGRGRGGKGGRGGRGRPKPKPAAIIRAPAGTKECQIKITSDAPGMMAFIGYKFPSDAQLSLENGMLGVTKFKVVPVRRRRFFAVGIGRASTLFNYTSATGGELAINAYAYCIKGCDQILTPTSGSGNISFPNKGLLRKRGRRGGRGGRRGKGGKMGKWFACEKWFTVPSGKKVQLSFSKFNVGNDTTGCTEGGMSFAKSGDKFYFTDTQKECGNKTNLDVTSSTNDMNMGFNPTSKSNGFVGTYTVV